MLATAGPAPTEPDWAPEVKRATCARSSATTAVACPCARRPRLGSWGGTGQELALRPASWTVDAASGGRGVRRLRGRGARSPRRSGGRAGASADADAAAQELQPRERGRSAQAQGVEPAGAREGARRGSGGE